jgi:methionyl-tRNA formyltransferase
MPRDSFQKQNHDLATYSRKVDKEESILDFSLPYAEFNNKLLSYNDEPGCHCSFRGRRLKIFKAEKISRENKTIEYNGIITDFIKNKGFVVTLPDADICITEVQYEGKKRMDAWSFHIGARLQIGERLGI